MRFLVILLLLPMALFGATESVSIDTKTKKVQNPIVNFGVGNTLNGTGATIIGFPGSSYTFSDSLLNTGGTVALVNDDGTPGNSQYYGTDSGGTKGFFDLPSGGGAVDSVFGRTGDVVAASDDYTAAQVTNAADTTSTYSDPAWITSLIWSKITSTPTTLGGYGITDAVAANGAITGATKTKITFDAKGLVTVGADATTADISDSLNKRYVTDANLVVIGNTSGTNTGDQTSIVGITGTLSEFNTALTGADFATGGGTVTGTSSGTNTGDQTITLTGDVTGSGTGSFATTIARKIRNPGCTIDGGGSAISTGKAKGFATFPVAGTITGWSIAVDTGTATVKVWKKATGTAVPTVSDNINTSGVAISTGTYVHSNTVSDFTTTTVAAGDIFAFNVSAVSGATELTFQLEITP